MFKYYTTSENSIAFVRLVTLRSKETCVQGSVCVIVYECLCVCVCMCVCVCVCVCVFGVGCGALLEELDNNGRGPRLANSI